MNRYLARGLTALGITGFMLVAMAVPAQAHSNYSCVPQRLGTDGASINCSYGAYGDRARVQITCLKSNGASQTRYSSWVYAPGPDYASVYCSTSLGYELAYASYLIQFNDGHSYSSSF